MRFRYHDHEETPRSITILGAKPTTRRSSDEDQDDNTPTEGEDILYASGAAGGGHGGSKMCGRELRRIRWIRLKVREKVVLGASEEAGVKVRKGQE